MINLNRLGAGRKLIDQLSKSGSLRNQSGSRDQQRSLLKNQPNPYSPKTRGPNSK